MFARRFSPVVLALALVFPGALSAQDASPARLVAAGDAALAEDDIDAARDAYRSALDARPDMAAAEIGLARTAMARDEWDDAGRALDRVLEREPQNIEAHYYRAIAHREQAKFHALLGIPNWRKATEQFDWVLAQDSLYRDALYQYALLRRYGEDFADAVALGEAQVRLKPELQAPRRGLIDLYNYYVRHTPADEALDWLDARASDYATFARAEVHRRAGDLDLAAAILDDLLGRTDLAVPRQPILLARARVHYAEDEPAGGQALVEEAVRTISSPLDASLVFEDFKYVFSDEELAQYQALDRPDAYRAFFNAFWVRRDPVPARPLNDRLAEHYRRILKAEQDYTYDGLRAWGNDPDKFGELDFPAIYDLNEEFNDKGLVYIRHGQPLDRVVTVAGDIDAFRAQGSLESYNYWVPKDLSAEAGWRPNESWRYRNPDLDFHFVVDEGAGRNNWRLTPAITNYEMLQDREHWGGTYARLASLARSLSAQRQSAQEAYATAQMRGENVQATAIDTDTNEDRTLSQDDTQGTGSQGAPTFSVSGRGATGASFSLTMDFVDIREQMVEASIAAVDLGLSTDRHTWSEQTEPLELPYIVTAFRGDEGQTDVEVHFAVPIGRLTQAAGPGAGTIDVELGCALFDGAWRRVGEEVHTKNLPPVPDPDAAVIDYCRLTAPPDSYSVAFHGSPVGTTQLGGYRFGVDVPAFDGGLGVSDILPATSLRPTVGPSRFNKGELYVQANPFARFSVGQPVYLYFEVYNLTYGPGDLTRYSVEYELRPKDEGVTRRARRLFGRGDRVALSLQAERTGSERSPREYTEIDVSRVDPGVYTLTVRITDEHTGDTAERTRELVLTK